MINEKENSMFGITYPDNAGTHTWLLILFGVLFHSVQTYIGIHSVLQVVPAVVCFLLAVDASNVNRRRAVMHRMQEISEESGDNLSYEEIAQMTDTFFSTSPGFIIRLASQLVLIAFIGGATFGGAYLAILLK